MRIEPLDLIEFDEPLPVSATASPMIPYTSFIGVLLAGMAQLYQPKRRHPQMRGRLTISVPEGTRIRIRCR